MPRLDQGAPFHTYAFKRSFFLGITGFTTELWHGLTTNQKNRDE